jgi:Protein of unknown function (DUF3383)
MRSTPCLEEISLSTIPASLFVNVVPSVLSTVGQAVSLNGLILTTSNRVPLGSVFSFSSTTAVAAFFGSASQEALMAGGGSGKGSGYFGGFTNSSAIPGVLLFAQYNPVAVAAYLWGGNAGAALTLAQLQGLNGSLNVVMDGYAHAIASISLAAANSFSAAAALIQAAFTDPTEASFTASIGATFTATGSGTNFTTSAVTGLISIGDTVVGTGVPASTTILSQTSGTPGGAGVYVTSNPTTSSAAAIVGSSTVLNVTVESVVSLAVGQTLVGAGVSGTPTITAQLTGPAGGVGTYRISGAQQQVASEAMTAIATAPLVTFDSQSGAFVITSGITGVASTSAFATGTLAASLLLTAATGAFLSQGAAAATPASVMNAVVAITTNWATYTTAVDPDGGIGNTLKQAFAGWKNSFPNRYMYVAGDFDVTARSSPPQAGCLGNILAANQDSGTFLISELTDLNQAAFVMGIAASINFNQANGRTDFAFRSQAGLVSDVVTGQAAINIGGNPQVLGDRGNGYNYYGAVGAGNANFTWLQRGIITGQFLWADSYVNQIWLNSNLQLALLNLQNNSLSIPFNSAGAALIEAALASPIQAGLNFNAFAPGTISSAQIAAVNTQASSQAGTPVVITDTLQAQGYYLQVLQQATNIRLNRGPWAITFWYLDRGSAQSISLSSVGIQ